LSFCNMVRSDLPQVSRYGIFVSSSVHLVRLNMTEQSLMLGIGDRFAQN
jgi:hypothetical protein